MIYIGSTFNRIPAFQRVGGWMVACINEEVPAAAEKELQLFLFRASSAYWSLCQMEELNSQCFEEYQNAHAEKSPSGDESQYFRFTSSTVVQLLFTFPTFFANVVQMQDKILRIIQSTFPKKVKHTPKSLNSSTVDRLERYGLDDELIQILRDYWYNSGKESREFRNLDQHYITMGRHHFLDLVERRMKIYLPDSPFEQNESKITYDQNRDAILFCNESFVMIHNCIEDLAIALGFQCKSIPILAE
jgi:hypothetical protein